MGSDAFGKALIANSRPMTTNANKKDWVMHAMVLLMAYQSATYHEKCSYRVESLSLGQHIPDHLISNNKWAMS